MDFDIKSLFNKLRPSKTPDSFVGIDIGASALKVVEVAPGAERPRLLTYGELQLGPYADRALGEAVSLPQEQLIQALSDLLTSANVSSRTGVLAMPLASSFVTILHLDTSPEETVDNKIRIEARKYIPLPLADVTIDWSELSSVTNEDTGETAREILLAAIQNEALGNYQQVLTTIGMQQQPIEIEVFGAIRSTQANAEEAFAIMDFGAQTSKLYIARKGMLYRIHRVYDGGSQCTKKIADHFGIDFEAAENRKRNYNPKNEGDAAIKKAFLSTVDRPLYEFKRVLDKFAATQEIPLNRVVLIGGCAQFPGFAEYASDIVARTVVVPNVFERLETPLAKQSLALRSASFTIATGALLRYF